MERPLLCRSNMVAVEPVMIMKIRLLLVAFLALCILIAPATALAEDTGEWSTPVRLSDSGHANRPLVKADPYGTVHVVWAEGSDETIAAPDSLYYTQLAAGTWTHPIDIVVTDPPETAIPEALQVDVLGQLVLLWQSGSRLLISRAPVAEPGSARAWTTSVVATDVAPGGGSLQIGADGSYNLLFAGADQVLSYVSSADGGATWSAESRVDQLADARFAIGEPYVAADGGGNLYAVWSRHAEAANWGPAGVWFARSTDDGVSWSSPQEISTMSGHGWPDVYPDSRGRLRLTWIGNLASGGRYQVISDDLGQTFGSVTVIATPDQIRGYAGRPQTIEDSGQVIHLIFGGIGNGAPDSIWYTKTSGAAWSPLLRLSANSSDSQGPAADIAQGHLMHVVWPDLSEYDIYYSSVDTGSPPHAVLSRPTNPLQEISEQLTDAEPSPSDPPAAEEPLAEVQIQPQDRTYTPTPGTSTGFALLAGVGPAIMLVVGVVLAILNRRKR